MRNFVDNLNWCVGCTQRLLPVQNSFWVFIIWVTLLNPISAVLAESTSDPSEDPVVWQPLDPSRPEHTAILRWHQALISNDYQSYLRAIAPMPGLSEELMRKSFEYMRATTPPTLMISIKPTHINPNGSKDYGVAGCMKTYGDPRELRMVAVVAAVQMNGEWKVVASGFGPPWNNLIRVCPVKMIMKCKRQVIKLSCLPISKGDESESVTKLH